MPTHTCTTAQIARNARLLARRASLRVVRDGRAQLLECPSRALQQERRLPCPCTLCPRARRPPTRPALRRRAQGAQPAPAEPTSVRSRLQFAEAVGADGLVHLLQLGLVFRACYSTGSMLKTCEHTRSGSGWSRHGWALAQWLIGIRRPLLAARKSLSSMALFERRASPCAAPAVSLAHRGIAAAEHPALGTGRHRSAAASAACPRVRCSFSGSQARHGASTVEIAACTCASSAFCRCSAGSRRVGKPQRARAPAVWVK